MSTNRYKYCDVVNINGQKVYDLCKRISIPKTSINLYHKVQPKEANRLDLIAFNYYGDSTMWWLLAITNNIIDPFIIPAGLTIKIPRITSFEEEARY